MRHGGARPLDDLNRSEPRTGEITTRRRKQRHVEKKAPYVVCALLTMKRLSKLTRQQAKHQGIELITEGSDGGFLISQAAAKIVKRLRTLQPN